MPGEKEMSWQDCLVDRRWLDRHTQRVREDLLRQVEEKRARLDPARREGKDAEVNALKREINYLRSREEMIGRNGLVPARHVTLWGLQRLLAQGQPPELGCQIFYGGGRKGPDAASLLELVFAGTCLDICALWKEQGRSQKTVANKVSILQHGPYQYAEKGKQEICETALSALEERYRAGRLPTLEAVAGNLRAAREEGRLRLDVEAVGCIGGLFSHVSEQLWGEQIRSDLPGEELAVRQLAALFILALLREQCWGKGAPELQWLRGESAAVTAADLRESGEPESADGPTGIFALAGSGIAGELLPDVELDGVVFRTCRKEDGRLCTPLEQVLEHNGADRAFLLCGGPGSDMSGAGKTTSLRVLRAGDERAVFVPLSAVYSGHGLRGLDRENGRPRLLTWLETRGLRFPSPEDLEDRLLLLDGLDEITNAAGVRALCDDLVDLRRNGRLRLVISSKLPPERLPAWSAGLSDLGTVWKSCRRCTVRPMRDGQKRAWLGTGSGIEEPVRDMLTTPFLLRMCGSVQTFLEGDAGEGSMEVLTRWVPRERLAGMFGSPEALFYGCLAVQACRWFDEDRAGDARSERDAFFLMYALPAVAFQMLVPELYDGRYIPAAARAVDRTAVEEMVGSSFSAFRRGLRFFPAYRSGALEVLAAEAGGLTAEAFSRGRAATILARDLNRTTLEWEYRFSSRAVQENLAMLHVANLFFAACHGGLGEEGRELRVCECPVWHFPKAMLEKAVRFADHLFGCDGATAERLQAGPGEEEESFSRSIFCRVGAELCRALGLPQEEQWRTAAAGLLRPGADAGAYDGYEVVLSLCNQARILRERGDLSRAAAQARTAIRFCADHPDIPNTDAWHSLSKVYLEQIKGLLNGEGKENAALEIVPGPELAFACRVREELERLRREEGGENGFFGRLTPAGLDVLEPAALIVEKAWLRLERYRERDFFGDGRVKFLLEASYTAKAYSVYAAFHECASGPALNLLGCFLENQQEVLENSARLPFFEKEPHLRIEMGREELRYPERQRNAFRAYLRIYNIRRGNQPYSARRLAEALLCRRVRLSGGCVTPGSGAEGPFTEEERRFLDEATRRSCTGAAAGYGICRIRFLNDRIAELEQNGFRSEDERELERMRREVKARFRQEWERCRCGEKLRPDGGTAMDLYTVSLIAEYEPVRPVKAQVPAWVAGARRFFREQMPKENSTVRYTTGLVQREQYLRECWQRLRRLERTIPAFRELARSTGTGDWPEVLARLNAAGEEP